MKKSILFVLFFLFIAITVLQAKPVFVNHGERYFKFEIKDRAEIQKLTRIISIDNVKDRTVFAYANQKEWDAFNNMGYTPVLLPAPSTLIEPRMASNDRDIWAFDTYPTYTQYETMMSTFASTYPSLCQIYTLGTLSSGRKLLYAHISSNVATPAAKPEVELLSTIHGDEVTGYVMLLHLINELLSKYGTDTRITNLVNNLDIWICPLENPDGTYTGGNTTVSGATRYNAAGIDLNRNFRDPSIGIPGTQAAETLLFQSFADNHHIVQAVNYHGGAEVFNYPWDDWTSLQHTHPDDAWFVIEGKAYVDSARVTNSSYMTDTTTSGYTEGGDWYTITGGRQDYTNYFAHGREVTIEISETKMPVASSLLTYWNYNYKSMLKYMERPYYAIRGTVTNSSGTGLAATITVNSHDTEFAQSAMITDPAFGDYYRMIAPGTWSLTFSATGYVSQTINNVVVTANTPTYLNVVLERLMSPPTNVQASGGNGVVLLTWIAPSALPGGGYKIYKNGSLLTTVSNSSTSYSDTAVTNGTTYSYYLVSVYTDPSGESAASNTVTATPNATTLITIGTGTSTQNYPMDRYYNYSTYESIFLQSEIGIAGSINKIAFYKSSGSDINAITSVTIYMMHTTSTTLATGTYSLTGYTQVYSGSFTNNATSGWMEITLNTPFTYNNTNNLQVLVVKGNQTYLNSGYPAWTYTSTSSNYRTRMNHNDTAAPTSLTKSYNRANIRLYVTPPVVNPGFSLSNSSLDFGNVIVGQSATRTFSITNTGGDPLTGTITTPTGYSVALASKGGTGGRNSLSYSVDAGTPKAYTVTFLPTQVQVYAGNITISSNDPLHPSNTLALTGIGLDPAHGIVDPASLSKILDPGTSDRGSFSISNTGDVALNYTLSISYLSRVRDSSAHKGFKRDMNWLSVTP
ncbi:MAG TPA: M14 family zinc carboxypeptidase, partial [Candidatus Cloacimonadota bacterium]|nr:M14 family zinc carboxypeptidase [Candidatus Cloacimonadota bacterium]